MLVASVRDRIPPKASSVCNREHLQLLPQADSLKTRGKNENRCRAMYGPLLARIKMWLDRAACT
jgi:hypothetical protein